MINGKYTQRTVEASLTWPAVILASMVDMLRMMLAYITSSAGPVVMPDADEHKSLFPTSGKLDILEGTSSTLCLTGLTTQVLPFKNENGELEWTFTDTAPEGDELDAFRMSPGHSEAEAASLSTPSSLENLAENSGDDENKTHACPHCLATFKIRGYLTRHLKKHATKKAYQCPFHEFSAYVDENNLTHRCHPNGGFSRRDTYKTHLKLRHFKYPKGTRTKQRGNSLGLCGLCGDYFNNAEMWCEIHIEGGQCKFLPPGFKGKLRILKKLEKQAKLGIPRDVGVHNYDMSQLSALELTPGMTPGSNSGLSPGRVLPPVTAPTATQATPGIGLYEYNHTLPAVSILLSIPPLTSPPVQVAPQVQQLLAPPPPQPQFVMEPPALPMEYPSVMPTIDDYDDEFCLDTDQLYFYDYPKEIDVMPQFSFTA